MEEIDTVQLAIDIAELEKHVAEAGDFLQPVKMSVLISNAKIILDLHWRLKNLESLLKVRSWGALKR